MVQCVLKVFIQLWNCLETCFCELGIWCLMAKESFSLVKSHSCREKKKTCHKNTSLIIFFLHNSNFGQVFVFWKKQAACHFCWKATWLYSFHLFRVTIVLAVNAHRPISPDHFSHVMVQCVLGVSLPSSENAGMSAFVNLAIGPWWQNSIFLMWKLNCPSLKLSEKQMGLFFFSL